MYVIGTSDDEDRNMECERPQGRTQQEIWQHPQSPAVLESRYACVLSKGPKVLGSLLEREESYLRRKSFQYYLQTLSVYKRPSSRKQTWSVSGSLQFARAGKKHSTLTVCP